MLGWFRRIYVGKERVDHLLKTFHENYTISIYWEGTRYLGMNLDWDHKHCELHVTMLDHVTEALKRFKHTSPRKMQHQLHPHVLPIYGAKVQYATDADSYLILVKEVNNFIQKVTVTFLYCAIAAGWKIITSLGSIVTQQANPTENKMKKVKLFLDYAYNTPRCHSHISS